MARENEESRLLALPTELLVEVFTSVSSLKTAVNLAATSRQLNEIWRQHLPAIFNKVAPACIPCYRSLRKLLDNLGHLAADTPVLDVDKMALVVRKAKTGDDFVNAYQRSMKYELHYDPQVSKDLSATEKPRFIRAHYQILELLNLKQPQQQQRIKELDLKTLFLLSDFLCIFDADTIEDEDLQGILGDNTWVPRLLQGELRARRNQVFRRLYDRPYRPISYTPREPYGRHAWWCDRQQAMLKQMVTGHVFCEDGKPEHPKVQNDQWYESDDE